ncbi:hypothetical protein MMC30_002884 [Trapelia coarctata]|nr:hypothetical protein [Trapelia coarctata]
MTNGRHTRFFNRVNTRGAFTFTFPESEDLPPSFVFCFGAISYGSPSASWGVPPAFVKYELKVTMAGLDSGERTAWQAVQFSPHRLTLLEDGPMLSSYPRPPSKGRFGVPTGTRGRNFMVTLHIARPSDIPVVRLQSFQLITATTMIGQHSSAEGNKVPAIRFYGPSAKELDLELQIGERTDLHTLDSSFMLSSRVKAKPPRETRSFVQGTIVPTFKTADISRSYRISAMVRLKYKKITLSASFTGQELVILPDRVNSMIPQRPPGLDLSAPELELLTEPSDVSGTSRVTELEGVGPLPELDSDGAMVELSANHPHIRDTFPPQR